MAKRLKHSYTSPDAMFHEFMHQTDERDIYCKNAHCDDGLRAYSYHKLIGLKLKDENENKYIVLPTASGSNTTNQHVRDLRSAVDQNEWKIIWCVDTDFRWTGLTGCSVNESAKTLKNVWHWWVRDNVGHWLSQSVETLRKREDKRTGSRIDQTKFGYIMDFLKFFEEQYDALTENDLNTVNTELYELEFNRLWKEKRFGVTPKDFALAIGTHVLDAEGNLTQKGSTYNARIKELEAERKAKEEEAKWNKHKKFVEKFLDLEQNLQMWNEWVEEDKVLPVNYPLGKYRAKLYKNGDIIVTNSYADDIRLYEETMTKLKLLWRELKKAVNNDVKLLEFENQTLGHYKLHRFKRIVEQPFSTLGPTFRFYALEIACHTIPFYDLYHIALGLGFDVTDVPEPTITLQDYDN
jgi:hypothetical protein